MGLVEDDLTINFMMSVLLYYVHGWAQRPGAVASKKYDYPGSCLEVCRGTRSLNSYSFCSCTSGKAVTSPSLT